MKLKLGDMYKDEGGGVLRKKKKSTTTKKTAIFVVGGCFAFLLLFCFWETPLQTDKIAVGATPLPPLKTSSRRGVRCAGTCDRA